MTSETSALAYDSIKPRIANDEQRIIEHLRSQRVVVGDAEKHYFQTGSTVEEAEIALGMKHQTASARFTGLAKRQVIIDSGQRRKTTSGRSAVVWYLSDHAP